MQSNTEREAEAVQEKEKTLYTELRSANLNLKIMESPLHDFKWDLNDMIRFAF